MAFRIWRFVAWITSLRIRDPFTELKQSVAHSTLLLLQHRANSGQGPHVQDSPDPPIRHSNVCGECTIRRLTARNRFAGTQMAHPQAWSIESKDKFGTSSPLEYRIQQQVWRVLTFGISNPTTGLAHPHLWSCRKPRSLGTALSVAVGISGLGLEDSLFGVRPTRTREPVPIIGYCENESSGDATPWAGFAERAHWAGSRLMRKG